MTAIRANNIHLQSWVNVPENSDFPIQNIPFGIFKTEDSEARVGTAIGDKILDLKALSAMGYLRDLNYEASDYSSSTLNPILKRGKSELRKLRDRLSDLLNKENQELQSNPDHIDQVLFDQKAAEMLLPVQVGDYTDFYSSEDHARNVGTMFRDPNNALLPNWKHIPVGYHGRSSSIIVSGTPFHRPAGQSKADDSDKPTFGPCRLLDFELEMAFITFDGKALGESISTNEGEDYIAGLMLFNDWSARDIQKWEYVPLGPFLGKNFASTVSPWLVTLDAFDHFRVSGPIQDPPVLSYLEFNGNQYYDINLEVGIQPENGEEKVVCQSNFKYMYWNMLQQLAHHTINGCNIRCGDMLASGTISGPEPGSFGSMLEISWKGTKPVSMPDGSERKFILDGDTVTLRGFASKDNLRIGFGECSNKVLPAKK
ncbi:MAG: fumarylacetoacetase [Bacteroidota bacterium]